MTIAVFSNLELYTTFIAWTLYDAFYSVIALTGLAWVPIAYIMFKTGIDSLEKNDIADAGIAAARVARVRIVLCALIIAFALVPSVNMSVDNLNFVCKTNGVNNELSCATGGAKIGNTGTSLDDVKVPQAANAGVKVPIFWYMMLALSGGITNAALDALPQTADLPTLQAMLAAGRIQDDDVRAELQAFVRDCYAPARARLKQIMAGEAGLPTPAVQAIVTAAKADPNDLNWPGSNLLMLTPGLYSPCYFGMQSGCAGGGYRATTPIPGWDQNGSRDSEDQYSQNQNQDLPGQPYCNEWWQGNGATSGLQQKVAVSTSRAMMGIGPSPDGNYAADTATDKMGQKIVNTIQILASTVLQDPGFKFTINAGEAALAKVGWENQLREKPAELMPEWDRAFQMDPAHTSGTTIAKMASDIFAGLGLVIANFFNTMAMSVVQQAGPIFQAILLMFITMALPFLMVLSRYELEALITVAVAFVTVRFWTALFASVVYIYNTFTAMAYNNAAALAAQTGCHDTTSCWSNINHTSTGMIIALVCSAMFMVLPGLFSLFLGWVGANVGSGLGAALISHAGENSSAGRSTQKGFEVMKDQVSSTAGAAFKAGMSGGRG